MLTAVFMIVGVLLVVLQTTVLQVLPGVFGRPDLVYLLVAFAAYRFAWLQGIVLSFTVGWIFDVLVGVSLGVYPLQCLMVFSCLKLITSNSPVKATAYEIPLVGISYFFLHLLVFVFTSVTYSESLPEWSWGEVVRSTLLLILAAIPFFLLFNSLYEAMESWSRRQRPSRRQTVRRK